MTNGTETDGIRPICCQHCGWKSQFWPSFIVKIAPKSALKIWCNFCFFFVPLKSSSFPPKGPIRCFSFETGPKCRQQIGLKADRSVDIFADSLPLQIRILSWIPINFILLQITDFGLVTHSTAILRQCSCYSSLLRPIAERAAFTCDTDPPSPPGQLNIIWRYRKRGRDSAIPCDT